MDGKFSLFDRRKRDRGEAAATSLSLYVMTKPGDFEFEFDGFSCEADDEDMALVETVRVN
jgi:hypothetical protein